MADRFRPCAEWGKILFVSPNTSLSGAACNKRIRLSPDEGSTTRAISVKGFSRLFMQ